MEPGERSVFLLSFSRKKGTNRQHCSVFEVKSVTVPRDKSGRTSHVCLNDAAIAALLRLRERTFESGMVCGGL
jgi:hypothetical protein